MGWGEFACSLLEAERFIPFLLLFSCLTAPPAPSDPNDVPSLVRVRAAVRVRVSG